MMLLVAYGGGHVAALAPVAQALRESGRDFVFLALTTAGPYLDRLGIPHIGFKDLSGAGDADVLEFGERLAADLPAGGTVPHAETVAYLGMNYRDLVEEHGAGGAEELYRVHGRQAFLPVRTMERVIRSLQPDLVLATNSPRAERAAIVAAGRCGVKSICNVDLFGMQEIKWIGVPGYADVVCVLNEEVRRAFIAYGRKPDEVIVTGNPAFDRLRDPAVVSAGLALRKERGWNDERKTVLWASNVEPEVHPFTGEKGDPSLPGRIEQYLRDFVAANHGYRLVVRYHPSQREVFVAQAGVDVSPATESVSVLLHAVDIVVVMASTVGLEAALAGRPVISVVGSVFGADAPYARMGISTEAATIASIGEALLAAGGQAGAPETGVQDGADGPSATARLLAVIKNML
ncbi:MAG: hypothetical protein JWQ80_445 [Massilia sp.]|nr:hypothetical protein [Massilia sp.]